MRNKYLAVGLGEWRDKQGNEKMENVVAVTKPKKKIKLVMFVHIHSFVLYAAENILDT